MTAHATRGGYLAELLGGLPDLRDGACVGHAAGLPPECWDSDAPPADRALAIETCRSHCPVLAACYDWASRQPPRSLSGTVAGYYRRDHRQDRDDAAALPPRCSASVTAGCATATAAALPPRCTAVRTRGSPAQALLRDCHRSNRAIAAETGVNRNAVADARRALETAGMITRYRAASGPRTHPLRKPRVRDQLRRYLLAGHEQSNAVLARLAGCDKELAGTVRRELEAEGLIPYWRAPRSTRNAWVRL